MMDFWPFPAPLWGSQLSTPENAQVVLGDRDVQHICSHLFFQHPYMTWKKELVVPFKQIKGVEIGKACWNLRNRTYGIWVSCNFSAQQFYSLFWEEFVPKGLDCRSNSEDSSHQGKGAVLISREGIPYLIRSVNSCRRPSTSAQTCSNRGLCIFLAATDGCLKCLQASGSSHSDRPYYGLPDQPKVRRWGWTSAGAHRYGRYICSSDL